MTGAREVAWHHFYLTASMILLGVHRVAGIMQIQVEGLRQGYDQSLELEPRATVGCQHYQDWYSPSTAALVGQKSQEHSDTVPGTVPGSLAV